MELDPIVSQEELENVPESLRGAYKPLEKDGKPVEGQYVLSVKPKNGYALEDITGLRNTASAVRNERNALQEKLKAFGEYEPETLAEKMAKLQELESMDVNLEAEKRAQSRVESVKSQMNTQHEKALKALQAERDEAINQLKHTLINDAARDAIKAANGNEELLLPLVTTKMAIQKTESGWSSFIRDEYGNPVVGTSGNNMSVGDYIKELSQKDAFKPAFMGRNVQGGGMSPDSQTGKAKAEKSNPKTKDGYISDLQRRAEEAKQKYGNILK